MKKKYVVYTDGACSNNQGSGGQPGGWGVVFLNGTTLSGGELKTTNNRMELTAVIEALKNVPEKSEVDVYSDSAYVINAFNQDWISNWIKRNWKTSKGTPVENQDLWKELISLSSQRSVTWYKVKGHSNNEWNDKADKLAVNAIKNLHLSNTLEDKVTISLSKDKYLLLLDTLENIKDKEDTVTDLLKELEDYNK